MTRSPTLFTLALLAMSTALSINMFLPALPVMADGFAVSYGTISVSIGGYLAASAVLALVLGPLSDKVGRRPVVICIIIVLTTASIAAALANTATEFLIARLFQAVMVGGFVLSSSIVRDTRIEGDVAPALATISSIMAIAPIIGPIIGGVVVDTLGWRAIFWLYAAFGAALIVIALTNIPETHTDAQRSAKPSATALLTLPRFWVLVCTIALSNSGFYIFLAGFPIVAATAFNLSASAMGIALGSITVGFLIGSLTNRSLSQSWGARPTMILGRVLACGGLSVGLITTATVPNSTWALLCATVFIGLGNGFTMPSANALLLGLNPKLAGTAMGVAGSSVLLTGAGFTTLTALILEREPSALGLVLILWTLTSVSLLLAIWERRF